MGEVAPAGVPPVLNRDVLRQARLLRSLAGTAVPVPEVLWQDGGDPPQVPPIFATSYVAGTSLEPLFDVDDEDDPAAVADRMRSAALAPPRGLIEPGEIGLGNEPVVSPGDEVERWCRLLATVDVALAPPWKDVAAAIRDDDACPAALRSGPRRLSARQHAGRGVEDHCHHRLGDLDGRRSEGRSPPLPRDG